MIKFIKNGGINTSDATAVAEDILKGKTAYVASGKVEGTAIMGVMSNADYNAALELCNDIKGNPAPKEGHIYGIKINYDNNTIERTDDARGKIAEATHDGHPENVTNDFDGLYPWSDIKSFMYDSSKEEVVAWYGDKEFTFTPEDTNVNIFTRIPRLWYKRYKEGTDEYWKIADYAAEGFIEFEGASPARYLAVGSNSQPRSVSKGTLFSTNSTQMRKASQLLGIYTGLIDIWTFNILQMLYLIEYANADSQAVLGTGYYASNDQKPVGLCDDLGMNSGCLNNSEESSVIYRGIEDVFGKASCLLDGIMFYQGKTIPYICKNWKKYSSTDNTDYSQLNYSMSKGGSNSFVQSLGLDNNYPLIIIPSSTITSSASAFAQDNVLFNVTSTTGLLFVGGGAVLKNNNGMFYCLVLKHDSSCYSRFLLHKIS